MIEVIGIGLLIGAIVGACSNSCNSQRIAERKENDRDENRNLWNSWYEIQLEKLNCPNGIRSRGIMGNMKKEGVGYPTKEQQEIRENLDHIWLLATAVCARFTEEFAQECADASGLTAYLKKHKADEK